MLFERVALIGVGLINSSLARVLRRDGLAGHISACARTRKTLDKAMELGLADSVTIDPGIAVQDADLVVLGTPMLTYADIAENMASGLKKGCIVSDVGSVKESVLHDVAPHLPEGVHLVPAHPVAGTEHSGPEAGFAELFETRWCIVTPPSDADPAAVDKVCELWRRAGMKVQIMDARRHDKVLAITSHVPHLISYTIVGT
ncbi:MAG: prephenate dehydrogenase/arogenate dehydrogenase family protein, partial [Rhodospirillales bacterium]|nr:prephenate dehydrogenase/arogenate dehydrogenase family protein [Rhodospirillales bacterium]